MIPNEAQAALLSLGYDLGPSGADGTWGQRSRLACQAFQRGCGLAADGILGPATAAALKAAVATKSGAGQPSEGTVPADWMPAAQMSRIIVHWTAGSYRPSGHAEATIIS